jgi:hypothetical protein
MYNYAEFVAGSWDKTARIWLNRKCTMTLTGKIFLIILREKNNVVGSYGTVFTSLYLTPGVGMDPDPY